MKSILLLQNQSATQRYFEVVIKVHLCLQFLGNLSHRNPPFKKVQIILYVFVFLYTLQDKSVTQRLSQWSNPGLFHCSSIQTTETFQRKTKHFFSDHLYRSVYNCGKDSGCKKQVKWCVESFL